MEHIFPEFHSLLQLLQAGRVSRSEKRREKKEKERDLRVSNTTYSNSQSDIAAALADSFDLAALSKNKRQ